MLLEDPPRQAPPADEDYGVDSTDRQRHQPASHARFGPAITTGSIDGCAASPAGVACPATAACGAVLSGAERLRAGASALRGWCWWPIMLGMTCVAGLVLIAP